ncbi:MAG: extracellular solute-binding protein [Lachnospiraceae bacterium]|nr:extracellular solute-binding protein [Lachnospiraceae bacterium]
MKKYLTWILIICYTLAGCSIPELSEIKTLELAVYISDSQLSRSGLAQAVNTFNDNNSNVKIEITNYRETHSDPWDALNHIKIDIIAGKGPDMIDFGSDWGYSPLISSAMLTDLYPLMQNDVSFNKQDFHFNIIESFAVGESLYVLVPSFVITSFATNNSYFSGLERMSAKQLVEAYDNRNENSILFPGETKQSVLGMICFGGLENYVDWGEGICYFDSDSFKEILHFANHNFPLTLNLSDDYSAKAFFTEGLAILYPVSIESVYGTARIRALYGETPNYIGYPLDSGNGNMANIANIAIGISATSKNKEEAWGFIKSLLDSDFQDNIKNGLPIRIDSLEQRLTAAMSAEYDEFNKKIVKELLLWEGEAPVNIYEITKEDAETLKSIITKIEFNASVDYDLYNIMMEEADYLFNDSTRTEEDVINIIQSRAQIYVSENK